MTIAITGASGHLGRRVAELVLERLEPSNVVLLSRTPEALAEHAERGAAIRYADFDDPGTLRAGLAGVDRALLISAVDFERRTAQHTKAIAAAREAEVQHVVYTSIPNPDEDNPALACPSHAATEEALRDSGLDWTLLRNNLYAEFQVPAIATAIARGQIVTSAGGGRVAYVSRDDCAAAAVAVLVSNGYAGEAFDITGPEAIGQQELAALAAELGGRPVEVVQVDDDALVRDLIARGVPEPGARIVVSFVAAARNGCLDGISRSVEDLTGSPPRSLRDVVDAHADEIVAR